MSGYHEAQHGDVPEEHLIRHVTWAHARGVLTPDSVGEKLRQVAVYIVKCR